MIPSDFFSLVIRPGAAMVPATMDTLPSRVLLMAIAGQESGWDSRVQVPGGQARGYWQCEQTGAVQDVMNDPVTSAYARAVCAQWDIGTDLATVFDAIGYHDILAYTIARLALWQDPMALPAVGDVQGAYTYYLAVWMPGDPRPAPWPQIYAQAMAVVT